VLSPANPQSNKLVEAAIACGGDTTRPAGGSHDLAGDVQTITQLKQALIIEPRIGRDPDRYILGIVAANQPYQVGNDTNNVVAVIAVSLPLAEDRVYDHTVPEYL
jgi:hypothetical protein